MKKCCACTMLFVAFLVGCSKPTFNNKDEGSIDAMASSMSQEEKINLLNDMTLVSSAEGGEHKLNGFTASEIQSAATRIRTDVKKRNIIFLKEIIKELNSTGKIEISLMTGSFGEWMRPKTGYRFKEYHKEYLEKILYDLDSSAILSSTAQISPMSVSPSPTEPIITSSINENSQESPSSDQEVKKQKIFLSLAAKEAIKEGFVEIKDNSVQACTDEKIKKEIGENSIINYEQYNEIAVSCGFNI